MSDNGSNDSGDDSQTQSNDNNQGDSTPNNGGSPNWPQQALASHNEFRALHGVPPMVLDDGITSGAQAYADYLAANNLFEHSTDRDDVGENLYAMNSSNSLTNEPLGTTATKNWYSEIKDYDYDNPGFSMETGHFTQVVWKNSQKLGLGVGFSDNGQGAVVVGRYGPAGNVTDQFADNVPPPQ